MPPHPFYRTFVHYSTHTHTKSRSFHKKNFTTMSCPLSLLHRKHIHTHTNTRDKGEKIHNNTHYRNHYDIYTHLSATQFFSFSPTFYFFFSLLSCTHTTIYMYRRATKKSKKIFFLSSFITTFNNI